MTLDEAINIHKQLVGVFRKDNVGKFKEEDNKRYLEWLEELKELREKNHELNEKLTEISRSYLELCISKQKTINFISVERNNNKFF